MKRRSVSQKFERSKKFDVKDTVDHNYRVTFSKHSKVGKPTHTEYRSHERCESHVGFNGCDEENQQNFKALKMPNLKPFVLKKPVTKNTEPVPFRLNTMTRAELRKQYEEKAIRYREEFIKKREEELTRRQKQKTPNFNLNF